MAAGISYMYRISGGCEVMKRCHGCKYLVEDDESYGFGKSRKVLEGYECTKHPVKGSGKNWKKEYTACGFFEEPSVRTVFAEERETGQLSFF